MDPTPPRLPNGGWLDLKRIKDSVAKYHVNLLYTPSPKYWIKDAINKDKGISFMAKEVTKTYNITLPIITMIWLLSR